MERKSTLVLLVIVILSMAWRPFLFGFYSDDYNIILEPVSSGYSAHELYEHLFVLFGNRPLSGVNAYILINVFGDSAFGWHSFAVIISFLIAFLIIKICRIFNNNEINTKLAIYASLWVLFPTNFGFLSWPVYFVHLPVVLWYLISFYFLIRNKEIISKDISRSLFFYALCIFTHESFYFQFIPMLGACVIYKQNFLKNRTYLKVGLLFFLLQVLAIIFNRVASAGVRKDFDFDFIITRVTAVINNPEYLLQVSIPILSVIGVLFYLVYLYKQRMTHKKNISNDQLMVANCMVGVFITICIYLSAGYAIRPFGLGSRTTMCFSVFGSLILFLIAKNLFNKKSNLRFVHFVFPAILFLSVIYQGVYWADSKITQEEVLDAFPADKVSRLNNSLILFLVPNFSGDVIVFEDTWSLTPAITIKYKELKNNNLQMLPHKNEGFRSSHSKLTKNTYESLAIRSGHKSGIIEAESIYIWNFYTKKLYFVDRDININAHSDLTRLDLKLDSI
jgi:hypothetical protein